MPPTAGLLRRLSCLTYELLIVCALCFVAAFLFATTLSRVLDPVYLLPVQGLWLTLVLGAYFVWYWTHGGQTLPMKTWQVALVTRQNTGVPQRQALARYLLLAALWWFPGLFTGVTGGARLWLAASGLLLLLVSVLWSMVDPDRQFLHDRLLGTRQIHRLPPGSAA